MKTRLFYSFIQDNILSHYCVATLGYMQIPACFLAIGPLGQDMHLNVKRKEQGCSTGVMGKELQAALSLSSQPTSIKVAVLLSWGAVSRTQTGMRSEVLGMGFWWESYEIQGPRI